jgi:hypothetical protein
LRTKYTTQEKDDDQDGNKKGPEGIKKGKNMRIN